MQHRRGGQQVSHVAEELFLQLSGGATTDGGQEPGGHIDRGQRLQQVAGAPDRQVVRAGEQRGAGEGFRADPHRRARRGHNADVLDRHGLVVPARGGDHPAARADLRDPHILGDLRGRRGLDVDDLTPPMAVFRGLDQ